jgi:hypothetical protein
MTTSHVRGLEIDIEVHQILSEFCRTIRQTILRHIMPMLERWGRHALIKNENFSICSVYLHLALVLANLSFEELNERNVIIHLCAHLMITTRHSFISDPFSVHKRQQQKGEAIPRFYLIFLFLF